MVRVVGHEHVALAELVDPEEVEGEAHREGRGEHELGDADAQGGQPALAVEDGGVALVGLVQDRRGGRARDVHGHLEADRLHRAPDDLGGDRVDGAAHHEAVPRPGQCLQIDVHGPSLGARPAAGPSGALVSSRTARHRPRPGLSRQPIADSRVTFHCTRPLGPLRGCPAPRAGARPPGRGDHHHLPAVELERAPAAGPESRRGSRRPRATPPTRAASGAGRSTRRGARRRPRWTVRSTTMRPRTGSNVETSTMVSSPRWTTTASGAGVKCRTPPSWCIVSMATLPAGPQHPVELLEHPVAVGVVVVAERVQPAHHRVERPVDREVADVPLEVVDRARGEQRVGAGLLDVGRRQVDAGHLHAGRGQAAGDAPVAAGASRIRDPGGRSSSPRISAVSASECSSSIDSS